MTEPAQPQGLVKASSLLPEGFDLERTIRDVAQLQIAAQQIAANVALEIRKAPRRSLESGPGAAGPPRSFFLDPFDVMQALGWKERRSGITYDMIKQVEANLAIVRAIINTRAAQISAFAEPYDETNSLGFVIRHKDRHRQMTAAETRRAREIERFLLNCGRREPNPYSPTKRRPLSEFMIAAVRETYLWDAVCTEVVPDVSGGVYEFYLVDGSTIRIALDERAYVDPFSKRQHTVSQALFDGAPYDRISSDGLPTKYVQVLHQQVRRAYSDEQLYFLVRNPQADVYAAGYGVSEIQQCITIITALLDTEKYQRAVFQNGALPKGMLNLKGTDWTPDMLEGMRRQWEAQLKGPHNAHKVPVIQFDGDLQWIDLQPRAKDLEYGKWHELLISICAGVFLIDPEEISIPIHGGVSQTPLFEASAEWKLKASRDRGLKPLLRFFAGVLQKIVDRIDDHFSIRFVGLDEPSEKEKHDRRVQELATFKSLNETREAAGLPRYQHAIADLPMNPTLFQGMRIMTDIEAMQRGNQSAPPSREPEGIGAEES